MPTMISGDFTLVYIVILLVLVVAITVMQSFESPALVSSFKGLLTVMSFVQSFVSLKVIKCCAMCNDNVKYYCNVMHHLQFLDVDWPPIMKELFALFKPLTFSLDFVRPECSVDLTPEQKLYAVLFVPISCCLAVAFTNICVVLFSLYRLNLKIRVTTPSSMQSLISGGFSALFDCLILSSFGKKLRRETIHDFGPLYFALNPVLFNNADWNVGAVSDRARRKAASTGSIARVNLNKNDTKMLSNDSVVFPELWVKLRKLFEDADIEAAFMSYVLAMKKSASGALSVLILSFVGVMETALPVLNCFQEITQDGSTKSYLRSDRSIECSVSNPMYRSLATMAVIGLLLYAGIVPVAMHIIFYSRWCFRFYRLDYASHNSVFGFVTSRYKRNYLSWELLNYLKKASQIAIPLFFANQPVQQIVLLFFLNCVFSVLVLYHMPFSSTFLNVMEIMSSLDLVVTVIVGIFFVVEFKGEPVMSDSTKQIFGFTLVILCAATLLASVLCILREVLYLTQFHKQPAVSAWLQLFNGNSGDSVQQKSLFNLFCTVVFNNRSSKSILDHNQSIEDSRSRVSCFWLKSWYTLLTYRPASHLIIPFLRQPLSEALKDLHQLTRRISSLQSVGIYCPKDKLDPDMLETHGAGDPPYDAYQTIAAIDNALSNSLSADANRYLLAILVADKFRKKDREDFFTQRYWERIVPRLHSLLDAVAEVQPTAQSLCTLKLQKDGFFARVSQFLWPDYSESHSMLSVVKWFNQMSASEHAAWVKEAGHLFDNDDGSANGRVGQVEQGGSGCGDDDQRSDHDDSHDSVDDRSGRRVSRRQVRAVVKSAVTHKDQPSVNSEVSTNQFGFSKRASFTNTNNPVIARTSPTSKLHGGVISSHSPPQSPRTSDSSSAVREPATAKGRPLNEDQERQREPAADPPFRPDAQSKAELSAAVPPPRHHKLVPDADDAVSPLRTSDSSSAVREPATAKGRPLNEDRERQREPAADPPFRPDAQSQIAPALPRAPIVFLSPSLQRTNALNQPLSSSSQRQKRPVEKSASSRPRHVVLASMVELEGAVAVDIPVGDDHKRAEFVFDWPAPAVPPPVALKSGAAQKLKAAMSVRSATHGRK